jgi:hypothetical protein
MEELAITCGIAFGGLLLFCVPVMLLSWLQSKQDQLYWTIHGPATCPQCTAKYDSRGQDCCMTRLVHRDAGLSDCQELIEPFLGQREFRCSSCGTVATYERKAGSAELQEVVTPDDVCQARRCLDCNDVFAIPAYGKCPICGGKKLELEVNAP